MTLPRCLGLPAALLVLHLNVLAAMPRCADRAAKPAPSQTSGHHGHEGHVPAPAAPDEEPAAPVVPPCCTALASCSVTIELTAAVRTVPVPSRAAMSALAELAPRSVLSIPDTPPPRA